MKKSLGAKAMSFRKKETNIEEEESAKYIGIILSGAAQIVRVDFLGNRIFFEIPYSRQELADYLEVERTGLSVEISKLCKQGFIETDKKELYHF